MAIFGVGGHAREIAWLLHAHRSFMPGCFVVDDASLLDKVNDLSVWSWDKYVDQLPYRFMSVALGNLYDRRSVVSRCERLGLQFPRLVDQSIHLSKFITLGEGTVICDGSVLTVNINIGNHVHINRCCSISHDVEIGDFATLSPGVNVSGHVIIGADVFIGAGATIINGSSSKPLTISSGAVIGAGACVTKSILSPGVYKGVPAK